MKYKLTISYDGTDFSGWQIQPNAPSIQETLEQALAIYLRAPCRIVGAGRTDAGVHALGQVAHVETTTTIEPRRFLLSVNSLLPHTIRILAVNPVADAFHAQYSALGKIYHYHLCLDHVVSPFVRLYRYHYPHPLCLDTLKQAALHFVGKKDFASFANVGSSALTTVRHVKRLDIVEEAGGVRLEFEGDGFLYKMVRTIVGTLLEVASHKRALETIEVLFQAANRKMAGSAAPACGLCLMQVHYADQEMSARG